MSTMMPLDCATLSDSKMTSSGSLDDLTTIYVYELALKLRNEFDTLIRLHGPEPYEGMHAFIVYLFTCSVHLFCRWFNEIFY